MKNSNKGFIAPIWILVGILILAGGAFLFWSLKNTRTTITPTAVSFVDNATPSVQPINCAVGYSWNVQEQICKKVSVTDVVNAGKNVVHPKKPTVNKAPIVAKAIIPNNPNNPTASPASGPTSPSAPTVNFTASSLSIHVGSSTTLFWNSQNSSLCTKSNDWSGSAPTSGSLIVVLYATKTFSLQCQNAAGGKTSIITVTVNVVSVPLPSVHVNPPDQAGASPKPVASSTAPLACTFDSQHIDSGKTVTAFLAATVPFGQTCSSEVRMCTNGVLSGSFAQNSCTVSAPTLSPPSSQVAWFESDSGINSVGGKVVTWQNKHPNGFSFYSPNGGVGNDPPLYAAYGSDSIPSVQTTVKPNAELVGSVLPSFFKKDGTIILAFWLPGDVADNAELFSMNVTIDDGDITTKTGISLVYHGGSLFFDFFDPNAGSFSANSAGSVVAAVSPGQYYIATIRFGGGAPTSIRLNGMTPVTGPAIDTDLSTFFGQPFSNGTYFRLGTEKTNWSGGYADPNHSANAAYQAILLYASVLTNSQVETHEQYLENKFNLCTEQDQNGTTVLVNCSTVLN